MAHHPLYLNNPQEQDSYYNLQLNKRTELLKLYKQCGVIAVLAGHTHQTIINNYMGIQLVNGEGTSRNFDNRPFGFRLWQVAAPTSITPEFIPLKTKGSEQ